MKKSKLMAFLIRKPNPVRSIRELMSRAAFEHEIECERARADRSGTPFTLLVVDIAVPRAREEYGQSLSILASVLKRRLRVCDSFGWHGTRVGVLLVGAKEEHVARIWKDVEAGFVECAHAELSRRLPLPELSYRVYTYPSNLQESFVEAARRASEAERSPVLETRQLVHGGTNHELR